jgi:Ran GTPase-activating protein (RanGAP) involved in mRNA processing and transport
MVCVNRKIVLREMNLGLNFSRAFVHLVENHSRYNMDKIASIDLSKNQLRDEGVIELSKILLFSKSLVKLDLSSNEITPKAIQPLAEALKTNNSLTFLALSTIDGVQRNRVGKIGGEQFGAHVLCKKDCVL